MPNYYGERSYNGNKFERIIAKWGALYAGKDDVLVIERSNFDG
jgi:hypothetical protein